MVDTPQTSRDHESGWVDEIAADFHDSRLGTWEWTAMDSWYYKLFGDEYGPVGLEELVELAKNRSLSSDDEVRFGEKGAWRRAGSMGQLMAHMASGSHVPSNVAPTSVAATPKSTARTSSRSSEPTR